MAIMALELQMSGEMPTIWTLAFPPLDQFPALGMDTLTRNAALLSLKPLCTWCGGTGNEFLSMYSKCPVCGGTGISPVKGLLVARTKFTRHLPSPSLKEFYRHVESMVTKEMRDMFGGEKT